MMFNFIIFFLKHKWQVFYRYYLQWVCSVSHKDTGTLYFMLGFLAGCLNTTFSRFNNLSFWLLPYSYSLLIISLFVRGGGMETGWTLYFPLSAQGGVSMDCGILALHLSKASFVLSAMNFMTICFKTDMSSSTFISCYMNYLLTALFPCLWKFVSRESCFFWKQEGQVELIYSVLSYYKGEGLLEDLGYMQAFKIPTKKALMLSSSTFSTGDSITLSGWEGFLPPEHVEVVSLDKYKNIGKVSSSTYALMVKKEFISSSGFKCYQMEVGNLERCSGPIIYVL